MNSLSLTTKTYLGLILTLALFSIISVYLPGGQIAVQQFSNKLALINIGIMIFLYSILGYFGLKFAAKLGFAGMWDEEVTNQQRFVIPAKVGIGLGILFIVVDLLMSQFHSFGLLPHPPFPLSIAASVTAGIGEEILFRLFYIPFWVWVISKIAGLVLEEDQTNIFFWVVTATSCLLFAVAHLPSVMMLVEVKSLAEVPIIMIVELLVLNGTLSLAAAYYLRYYGFLAAVGVHFWTDIVWHVIWGALM